MGTFGDIFGTFGGNGFAASVPPPPDEAVYIDFDNSASGRDGSIANPFNSWSE